MATEEMKELIEHIGKKHWTKIEEEQLLQEGEILLGATRGIAESQMRGESLKRECRLLVTDQRLVVYMPKMLGRYEMEDYLYSQITSIKKNKGFAFAELSFSVANNWQKIGMIDKKRVDEIHKLIQEQIRTPTQIAIQNKEGSKFCGQCGESLPAEFKFCSKCGSTQ